MKPTSAALFVVVSMFAISAHAEEPDVAVRKPFDRAHTIAELEAGMLALPQAPIAEGQRDSGVLSDIQGDATIMTGLHLLYRGDPSWAIGAGALFAPSPTSTKEYGGLRGLNRSHSRSYLYLGTEARYIPIRRGSLEGWLGLTGGAIIVADRFSTDEGDRVPTILGTREVTVRTEGFALGLQAGGSWIVAEHWVVGLALRADRWLLPTKPRCSSIGDCSTLSGTVVAFEGGLTIGYRLPL